MKCPSDLEKIAENIIEHCLEYLIRDDAPSIILREHDNDKMFNLNRHLEEVMMKSSESKIINISDKVFYIRHIKLHTTYTKEPFLHLCANTRVVKSEKILKRIPNLKSRLTEIDNPDKEFIYTAYVDSKYLDDSVNADRSDYNVPKDNTELEYDDLSMKNIIDSLLTSCKEYLAPYTKVIQDNKTNRIHDFVSRKAPIYKPIMELEQTKNKLELLDPAIVDEGELEICLYKIHKELQIETKIEGESLFHETAHETDEAYEKKFDDYFDKVKAVNATDLARYVIDRKIVIELVKKLLSLKRDGKYSKEKDIHDMIFPMGKTSDEIPYNQHHLWLIDEKLVYHKYLASDKKISKATMLESESKKEPDIVVFNHALAYSDTQPPYSSVVIIEFKKPMRVNYEDKDNPITQLYGYISDIRSGISKTDDGRRLEVLERTPFFGYIICDINEKIDNFATMAALIKTPDERGYFGYNSNYNAYIEVISYDKMIQDSEKRNAVFFEKLGLPSRLSDFV